MDTTDLEPPENEIGGCAIDKELETSLNLNPQPDKQNQDLLLRALGVAPPHCNILPPTDIWLVKQFTGWSQVARDITSREDLKMPYLAKGLT